MPTTRNLVALEPAAQALIASALAGPAAFALEPDAGRRRLAAVQRPLAPRPEARITDRFAPDGPDGPVSLRIVRPCIAEGPAPVVVYVHGSGWGFGDVATHDRLVRELAAGTGAAVVFPNYSPSPQTRYPTALEEIYAVLTWVAEHGQDEGLDGTRIAVAGDSVGGTMATAIALMAGRRRGPALAGQVLFYPAADARFDTGSYHEFADAYLLRRASMVDYWERYTADEDERAEITASPLRATREQLVGLPPTLLITAEADVLRDEGEAYGRKLRRAGVDVSATRYGGIIHDFVLLDALRETHAADAAIRQACTFLRRALNA